jgi:HAD superfamily hydrolase (TIGR01509 family)
MDGVIIDSHPIHRQAWRTFLRTEGREVAEAELDFILDGRKREEILCFFLGELTPSQIAQYGARKDEVLRRLAEHMRPIRGVEEFLESLSQAGIRMALATSASYPRAHGTLKELNLAGYFDAVVTGDEVASSKPDPAIYRLVAERLKETPTNLLAVEDAVSGVKSARAAGMRCLGIAGADRADQLKTAGADPVIPNFESFSLQRLEACFR